LFCQPKDLEREIWDGIRFGPRGRARRLRVWTQAHSVAELDKELPKLLENQTTVWFPFATHEALTAQVDVWLTQVRARVRMGVSALLRNKTLCTLLDEMRLVKDAHEQDTMRRAARISAHAHVRAMQTSARMLRAGQDVREYHLDAELLHEFRLHGSPVSCLHLHRGRGCQRLCVALPRRRWRRFAMASWC
jgi:Xaa-Pro aminopeptidase